MTVEQGIAIPHAHCRVELWGLEIDAITEREAIDAIVRRATKGDGGVVFTPNVELLRQFHRDEKSRRFLRTADLVLADGTPLVWASKIAGRPLPERVAGSSMTLNLAAAASERNLSMFLIGGDPGVAMRAGERLQGLYPALRIAGTHCPPRGFLNDPDLRAVMRSAVAESDPDIVLIGLPFPMQGDVVESIKPVAANACLIGVGVSLSFVTGDVRRAPRALQRMGFEWAHRLAQEPRRLARRYLLHGMPFVARLLAWSVMERFGMNAR
jgi:N-acetylglucosaminyldiphosphoundecaprenol N-acetyl-beta-D-mannosaminyltransferase